MKKHFAVMLIRKDYAINTTLCGRLHRDLDDALDNNLTDRREDVTCLLCSKILENPKHWRYRKFIKSIEEAR